MSIFEISKALGCDIKMPRRDRSLFRSEGDFATHPLLEELIRLVDTLAQGWSVATPFKVIMKAIGDIVLLLKNLLEEGIPTSENATDVAVNEGVDLDEGRIKRKFNLTSVWIPDPSGKWIQDTIRTPDPLYTLVDERKNVTSRKTPVPNPPQGLTPQLEEWLSNIITTTFALADNPAADPNFLLGQATGSHKEQKKLNFAQYGYWQRKRASRKSKSKKFQHYG